MITNSLCGWALALTGLLALSGCPTRPADDDDDDSNDTYGEQGYPFSGPLVLDDARTEAADPSAMRQAPDPVLQPVLVRVQTVIDGDTMEVERADDGAFLGSVRFIGVNAPELNEGDPECYGLEARNFTHILEGRLVWLSFDETRLDPFQRLLAYPHVGDRENDMWARQLIRRGLARANPFQDTPTFHDLLAADEQVAREAGVGLWAACP